MARFSLAVRTFFRILGDAPFAEQVVRLVSGGALPPPPPPPAAPPPPPAAVRSEALTLLATLQREARFVDFVQEPLTGYTDAQIGAAARDVHRDCGKVLERLFALHPVDTRAEGAAVELPAGFDAGRFRLSGNVAGVPPYRGTLRHPGWEAGATNVPAWSGPESAARVVAPAEIEVTA
ncbi:MAG: DUF2760 domain-containing protein [Planctomycetes bacterium]|nr:DUF2760 domain-containing protein [Planctomycetota bacterium]